MICPVCGARNGDRAEWCTQCYAALSGADPDPPADAQVPQAAGPPPEGGNVERDVRVTDDRVEWRCTACGTWTSLFEATCQGCGGARDGFAPPAAAARREPHAGPTASLLAGALLPGLGHLLQGVTGTGAALLLLWLLWGGGAVASRGGAISLSVVLALSAAVLWAASLLDLRQRLLGAAHLVTGRLLAWSTVGVTALLVLVALGSGLAAGR